jgi:glucosamine-6-phosphate deaminase
MAEIPTSEYGKARVRIYPSRQELGAAAAAQAAQIIRDAVRDRGKTRIIVATGNSQLDMITALAAAPGVPWNAVEVFHMDEYAGIGRDHPSSFRYWIRTRVEEKVHPKVVHYIEGDAADPDTELVRYARLLDAEPVDLAFVGFGENGHIAFNDPHVADFQDPLMIKRVTLDDACRKQQAGEGHFATPDAVPREAFTITCPGLFRAANWVCCVPERRKAEAVRNALEGPISTRCPSSIVRTHPNATVYLDQESASLLSGRREQASTS